jgi:ketosteroid isomerase-like protein
VGLSVEEAAAVFERRRRAWLAADVDAYLACFADDLEITVPGRDEPIRGIEAYGKLVRASFGWARPRSFEFHHLAVAGGDVVLAEWTISTEKATWRGMSTCALADGRIRWWREYWDPAQLG